MLRTFKRDQRLIQALRLPIGSLATPVARVRRKSINELMSSPILRRLIAITSAWTNPGRTQQRKPQRLVIRFVRAVLTIRQNRHAESSAAIRQVEPLVRRHLKLPLIIVAALDRADVPVVSRFRIRGGKRKSRLQIGVARLPVDHITKLDAV